MPTIIKCARGRITAPFGADLGRGFPHRGLDIGHGNATADDLRIVAPADGIVEAVGRDGTYGLRVIIRHYDGAASLIAHLAACWLRVGDPVEQGEHIATMGNSGTVYVHAHQEYRNPIGVAIDPAPLLRTVTGAGTGGGGITPIDPDSPEDIPLEQENDIMLIILATPAHGHYAVAPGYAAGLRSTAVADGIRFRPEFRGAEVWDISPDHIADYVQALSGCPFVPHIGQAWHAGDTPLD